MIPFVKTLSVRWADLDPNFHVRHSVYYDFGAQQRVEILEQSGLSLRIMQEQGFGPIIFREECLFKKEIRLADQLTINAKIARLNADASRWTIVHEIVNTQNILCAVLTVEGAWLDTKLRKLANPTPQIVRDVLQAFPKAADFSEV
ncbi:thioesterase family protein [Asinibacterium sp. OR53]|uniref:acyl-CoA thioesterase n=1 Tax=Asinibacterium sp. OR53 TaxID=925409 RepID=UPI00047A79F7|nr:thioesterase family protein [Asinibacterium sp. OR53]